MITAEQLSRTMPTLGDKRAAELAPHLAAALSEFKIEPGVELAMLLAQLGHESIDLKRWEEGLHYTTAERICAVFGKRRFPDLASAQPFVGQPTALANYAYAGMNGNGGAASGDGWLFRGRGPVQTTGRANYRATGAALKVPLEHFPDQLLNPSVGFRAACWFWTSKGCPAPARKGDVLAVTKIINGGTNGLDDRKARFERACKVLGVVAP